MSANYCHVLRHLASQSHHFYALWRSESKDGTQCPVFVFKKESERDKVVLLTQFVDKSVFHNNEHYLVGYDIEYQAATGTMVVDSSDDGSAENELEKRLPSVKDKLLSHQWYFSFPSPDLKEITRFGVILLTEHRLTENQFCTFIGEVMPSSTKDKNISKIFVSAHFSLIEGGFLLPGYREKTLTRRNGSQKKILLPIIEKRGKSWGGRVAIGDRAKMSKKDGVKVPMKIWLHFCDSIHLLPGGLAAAGEKIGMAKIKLKDGEIEDMAKLLADHPNRFYDYAIRDSIITAEVFAYMHKQMQKAGHNVKPQKKMTNYSELYFKNFLIETYGRRDWRRFLGWERVDGKWVPSWPMLAFTNYYFGGRNEVLRVGPLNECTYHDLKSAYPTSLLMLPDYDFSTIDIRHDGNAEEIVRKQLSAGPFQVIGVTCSFRFRSGTQPMFPVKVDEGLLFPMSGHAHVMWPELWVALENGLLEVFHVFSVAKFKPLNTNLLSKTVQHMLLQREDENVKDVFKNLLNFFYGKTSQGVQEISTLLKKRKTPEELSAPTSSITCFPMSAYMTSFCRAVIGELLNERNDCVFR